MKYLPTTKWLYILIILFFIQNACIRKVSKSFADKLPFDTATMNLKYSPFQNFDAFANGKWKDTAKLPNGYSRWGAFNILNEENEKKIADIIFTLSQQENKNNSEAQQIGDLYLSYLDSSTREARGLNPLKNIFTEIDAQNSVPALMTLYFLKYKKHISNVVDFGVDADARNSKMNTVYLSQSGLSIGDRDYYLEMNPTNTKIQKEFQNFIVKIFKALGNDDNGAKQIAADILKFETAIATFQINKVERRDPVKTYNKTTIAALDKTYPVLKLPQFVSSTGKKFDTVIVENLSYLKNIDNLIYKSPLTLIKNWLKFKFVDAFADYLNKDIVEANRYFYKEVMYGTKTEMPKTKKALKFVNGWLGNPLGKIFVKEYFPESSKQKVIEMIENMRAVYKSRLEANDWMSANTKKEALKKLAAFTYKIGYPNKWKNYSNVSINKKTLVENAMNLDEWGFQEMTKKIGMPVDKQEWLMSPQEVNAYYNPLVNEIVFPAGILQAPFYNAKADDAINYGGILAVIGHEFTHGFDDQGSQFDETGNLRVWWTGEDRKKFNDKAAKLGEAYSDYKGLKSGATINAKFTMGENIADLGGITLSYYALLKSLENKPAPQDIDGYNYKQRFFLSWAQVWRAIQTDEYEKNQTIGDPHSPANARINVTTSLLKEFQDAWQNKSKANDVLKKDFLTIW